MFFFKKISFFAFVLCSVFIFAGCIKEVEEDLTPPAVITSVEAVVTTDTVTFTWTNPSDKDYTKMHICWEKSDNAEEDHGFIYIDAPDNTATFKDLSQSTKYKFSFYSVDTSENESEAFVKEITTKKEKDITPPVALTSVEAEITADSVVFTWTNPSDEDYTKMHICWVDTNNRVEKDFGNVSVPENTFRIYNLTSSTKYKFSFSSVDTSGNESEPFYKEIITKETSKNTSDSSETKNEDTPTTDNKDKDSVDDESQSQSVNKYQSLWGTWIQMDTGDEYYIDSEAVYSSSSYYGKKSSKSSYNISDFVIQSDNVIKNGNKVFFRKGGAERSFSVNVSGFSDTLSRAASSGSISVKRKNKNNENDKQSVIIELSDTSTSASFTKAVADDEQVISFDDSKSSSSVTVLPRYNGENIGTVPIVESGMYGFKTTYTIDSDEQGFLFGNYYKQYNLKLNINNVGSEICSTSVYEISCDDPQLQIISGETAGNFSSIEAGKSKEVALSITYGKLEEEYVDVPISISITDSQYERTWNDSVTLRFYKGTVTLKINSRNFDKNSSAKLNGFVIYPDSRSKRFTVSAGSTESVLIPWSKSDYHLAFSGATASNEMAYSFGFSSKTDLADLSGVWSISDINSYEKNDSIAQSYKVTDLTEPIKSYLKNGDIDFYTINNSDIEIKFEPVVYVTHAISDAMSDSDLNNGDGKINPSETLKMDVRVHNVTDLLIKNISAVLSTTSEYVTIDEASKSYEDITGGYYKTLYGAKNYASEDGRNSSTNDYGSNSLGASSGWQFTVAANTPAGTEISFTLTFTDIHGNSWTDTFTVTVQAVDVDLIYVTHSISDATSYSNKNNGDGKINPGEVVKMDVRIQNTGSSLAQSITARLNTNSKYVTIDNASKSYANITGGYYKTLYGAENYSSEDGRNSSTNNYGSNSLGASSGWQFTVASNTPKGTVIYLTLFFKDLHGNIWYDDFSVTVQ